MILEFRKLSYEFEVFCLIESELFHKLIAINTEVPKEDRIALDVLGRRFLNSLATPILGPLASQRLLLNPMDSINLNHLGL